MEFVNLGKSGLKVSRLSLGAMSFGDRAWRSWLLDEDEALMRIVFEVEKNWGLR